VYRNATGLSGSTILGNGHVALILDVANVMKCARQEERDALVN
jgi:chemotaxis protein histidine kinase CheA